LYPQLRKAERVVAEELERAGFAVLGSASAADPASLTIAVELAFALRAAVVIRPGPPAGLDRAGDFLATWPRSEGSVLQGPYVRADGRLAVETRQGERTAEAYLRERLPRLSLGRNVSTGEASRVSDLTAADDGPALEEAMRGLLAKGLPWP
jgi:tRNA nucleotidyltransferase (CCA-adding enzyme)